jgi:hypothetical protein
MSCIAPQVGSLLAAPALRGWPQFPVIPELVPDIVLPAGRDRTSWKLHAGRAGAAADSRASADLPRNPDTHLSGQVLAVHPTVDGA